MAFIKKRNDTVNLREPFSCLGQKGGDKFKGSAEGQLLHLLIVHNVKEFIRLG